MAGYILYSLDWDKFQAFVNNPTDKQILAVAKIISEGLGGDDDEADEDFGIRAWPKDPKGICPLVKDRLARRDWYGDLSDVDRSAWSSAIEYFCSGAGGKTVGFRVDHNGIYWPALDLAWNELKVERDQIVPGVALSAFGRRPARYHPPTDAPDTNIVRPDDDDGEDDATNDDFELWTMHSMHMPDEVRSMLEELRSVRPAIEEAKNKQALRDYEDLLSVLETLNKEGRMLFVQVDT